MFTIIVLLTAVCGNLFISLFTLLKNPKSATNRLFFMFTFVIAVYLVSNYQINQQSTDLTAFFWVKLVMCIAALINIFFYLLVATFPKQRTNFTFLSYVIIFGTTFGLMLASLTGFIFISAKPYGGGGIPGPAMPLFLLHTVIFLGGGFWVLIKKFKHSFGIEKIQIKLFLLGAVFMFLSLLVTNLLFVLIFKTSAFIDLLPVYTLIFVTCISYAIIKHRFLDIRLVVARTVSYTLLIGLFGLFYAFLFAILSSLFISTSLELRTVGVSTTLALVMAFSFQPIRRLLEKITDSVFYKENYDINKLLYNLALIMASTLRLEEVTHGILNEILDKMRISKGAFILIEKDLVFDIKSEKYKQVPSFSEEEIKILDQSHSTLIFDELEESELKNILRKQELSVVAHLRTEGKQVGLLILGNKLSGDIFTEQDIRLIEILTPEAAIAIQNAKAYEEIRRFNITLQEEVNKATKDLQEANIKLQELDKLKDEFVSLASHELRTPMTAIKGSLSTILDGYTGQINASTKEFLTAAFNENDRLIRLVNNLLNISRIEAGRITFTITKIDLDKLIKEVKEILINLIGNALKFTHQGGVTVSVFEKDNMITTAVSDTGHGIAKEDQDLLFKKFSQVKGSYAKQSGGTGLGLYISKKMIEGMKGNIWLESEVGKGSTFYFSLPKAL
ncbi:MAG: Sensory transduction histidine kinase [Candidatus Gottesmanbacteria bacterium GW2011_GWA1_34_13]|uniref:histidine kinase n=1 Tax=Candidatus Gottesmanbacteria bacterium GW2011_GWA1_34_13 TaxID=1618434 RepID=A0A0G0ASJ5_9BACT|nr:MAG: Sensory transduction histidine kinase [Candidatus Gottesmanbacteria bacterium GW2011_GWA1_34_13]